MPAHFEATGGIIRYSKRPDWRYGEPFDFALFVVPTGAGTVLLKGLAGKVPIAARRDIEAVLRAEGWKRAKWDRIKDGRVRSVTVE